MAWTAPTTRATGELITSSIWNTDLADNLRYLKGTPGQVVLEDGIVSDTDNLDGIGTGAKIWKSGYFGQLWGGRFKATPSRRELRVIHETPLAATWQVAYATGGAGANALRGGSGQLVLSANNNNLGQAHFYQEVEINNSLNNVWQVTKNPYFRCEFSLDVNDANIQTFMGLRATPSLAIPLPAAEIYAGIRWNGTLWHAAAGNGVADVTTILTVAAGSRHVFEVWIDPGVKVEFWLDGVRVATNSTYLPSGNLEWDLNITGSPGGAGNVRYLTLGQWIVQEDVP